MCFAGQGICLEPHRDRVIQLPVCWKFSIHACPSFSPCASFLAHHMKDERFSRRERQIMDILHARGRASAAEVLEGLPDPPSYSAVRALLRILEEKGHVCHRQEGNRYLYQPQASRRTASRSALRRVVDTFFGGSVTRTMASLLEQADTELSPNELKQIREIVEGARKADR